MFKANIKNSSQHELLSCSFCDHVSPNINWLWLLLCYLRVRFQLASPPGFHFTSLRGTLYINIYTFILERSACSVKHPCALSALELFFCDFSAARPRFVARLAPSDSPQSRGPCPRAGAPSPRPSRSASDVARSRLSAVSHTRPNHSPVLTALFLVSAVSHTRPNHSPVS